MIGLQPIGFGRFVLNPSTTFAGCNRNTDCWQLCIQIALFILYQGLSDFSVWKTLRLSYFNCSFYCIHGTLYYTESHLFWSTILFHQQTGRKYCSISPNCQHSWKFWQLSSLLSHWNNGYSWRCWQFLLLFTNFTIILTNVILFSTLKLWLTVCTSGY